MVRAPEQTGVDRFLSGEQEPAVPTQPETEPTEEPTAAPTTQPETEPVTEPTQPQEELQTVPELSVTVLIIACLGCVLLGAAVGVTAMFAVNKKKK